MEWMNASNSLSASASLSSSDQVADSSVAVAKSVLASTIVSINVISRSACSLVIIVASPAIVASIVAFDESVAF